MFSPLIVNRPGGVYLESFIIRVTVPTTKPVLGTFPLAGSDASHARQGERDAYWPQLGGFHATPLYAFDALEPGNALEGPAIVEADLTTVVVPPGSRFSIDEHKLGILENIRVSNGAVAGDARELAAAR